MAEAEEKSNVPTIADDLVVTKYKMAAEIVNCKFLRTFLTTSLGANLKNNHFLFSHFEGDCRSVQGWILGAWSLHCC